MNIPRYELVSILNGSKEVIEKYKKMLIEKTCACCGNAFSVQNRIDEIYCPECRKIGYQNTMNDIQKDIVRERKRVHALLRRGKISREQYNEHMKNYKNQKRIDDEKLTIEEAR